MSFLGMATGSTMAKQKTVTTGTSGPPDPFFSDVVLLLEFEGTDGDTTTTDESSLNQTVTFINNAQIDNAQVKVGSTSAYFDNTPEGDQITVPSTNMTLGTSDFTIECWVRTYDIQTPGLNGVIYDQRTAATNQARGVLYVNGFNGIFWFVNGSNVIAQNDSAIFNDTWYHIALARVGTTSKLFVDGVQVGSSYSDSIDYLSGLVRIGGDVESGQGFRGWIDNTRVTIGTGRYTDTFTPPIAPFPTF